MTTTLPKISAIILSGGKATRMGGTDKGLMPLAGRPMISYVIDRLQPQVDELLISANREPEKYAQFDLPILSDQHAGFIGPLAGFQLGLKHASYDYVLAAPCDAPLLDPALVTTLYEALIENSADIAVAKSDGNPHPVFCLCKKSVLTSLEAFIEKGQRKVSVWQKSLAYVEVDMSEPNADGITEAFVNVNTTEDLALVEAKLSLATDEPTGQDTIQQLTQLIESPDCESDYDPNSMPVTSAKTYIQQFLTPLQSTENLPLAEALGRVLATDILAPANVPNYDNSAMDGFAFHSSALDHNDVQLKIVGTVLAGNTENLSIKPDECVRIMTGGMIPQGADTVVMQERTTVANDILHMTDAPKPHANVRYAGEDLSQGQVVLASGQLLKPADIGLIASLGVESITVYTPLKVAVFSTGDELVQLGKSLETGQVYDSNRYTIISMLRRLGVTVIDKGAIADDPITLEQTLLAAAKEADVVITSGGVSVGQADYMKQLLTKHGKVLFWKLAMKPGRPLAYGKLIADSDQTSHYFGLPGNPVAVMVTFYQFVREALQRLTGQTNIQPLPTFEVKCTSAIKKMPGRTEFQRGILYQSDEGEWLVKSSGAQSSAMLSSMSNANCFIVLDEDTANLPEGSVVSVQLFNGVV